jgi:hypothetical protein
MMGRAPAPFLKERIQHNQRNEPNLRLFGPLTRRKYFEMRTLFEFSAEIVECGDCLAERDEFEPSVPIVRSLK